MAGDLVEQAYREGKFPESRRQHYYNLMAKRPKKTAKLLASLAAMLPPPEDQELLDEFAEQSQAAPVAATATPPRGPKAYPKGWLGPGEVGAARAFGGAGSIIKEEGTAVAEPGEVL